MTDDHACLSLDGSQSDLAYICAGSQGRHLYHQRLGGTLDICLEVRDIIEILHPNTANTLVMLCKL